MVTLTLGTALLGTAAFGSVFTTVLLAAEYAADGPTILLFTPQGTDRDTLMHEFSHYIEWLSEGEAYHDRAERNVDSYERDVKERTNDFMF